MKYSKLQKDYHAFERWSATIRIDGSVVYPAKAYRMSSLHIELSTEIACNCAYLSFQSIHKTASLFDTSQTGARIEIFLGYQAKESCVFMGYLHEVHLIGNEEDSLREVQLYAQDVKGLMMLRKHARVKAKKKRSAWLQEILQDSFYKSYVKKVSIGSFPSALDEDLFIDGKSDYDVVAELCEDCFCSCYVAKDTLYFKTRGEKDATTLVIDDWNDIDTIEQKTTMANQLGKLSLSICDGFQKKQKIETTYLLSDMPQSKQMGALLKQTEGQWTDAGFHSMDELRATMDGLVQEVQDSYGRLIGSGAMLPELLCGYGIEVTKFCDGKTKAGVLCRVEHNIDEDGATSEWEAILTKG